PIGRHGLNAAAIALIAVIRPTAFATASDGNHLRSTVSPERTLTVEAPAIAAAVYEVSNGARTPDDRRCAPSGTATQPSRRRPGKTRMGASSSLEVSKSLKRTLVRSSVSHTHVIHPPGEVPVAVTPRR